jgi:hypothetical protein
MNSAEMQALEDQRLARMTTTERANHCRIVAELKAAPHRKLGIRFVEPPGTEQGYRQALLTRLERTKFAGGDTSSAQAQVRELRRDAYAEETDNAIIRSMGGRVPEPQRYCVVMSFRSYEHVMHAGTHISASQLPDIDTRRALSLGLLEPC